MALHFSPDEYEGRKASVLAKMADRKLDALLLFSQETMYWLTGYDTTGFNLFQCLVLRKGGQTDLLTRSADVLQAKLTSNIDNVHIWSDRIKKKASPAMQLRGLLDDLDMLGSKIGIEYDAHGLTAKDGRTLDESLRSFADTEDASRIIPPLRAIKSGAEIAFVRKAGELTDLAYKETLPLIAAGADESKILATLQGVILENGGDYPANDFVVSSGEEALLCRYNTGRRLLDAQDQLTLEWSGVYRHFHAPASRTIIIGRPQPRHRELYKIAMRALQAMESAMTPGHMIGEIFDTHAHVVDDMGANKLRLNACGYSVGASFAPSWMDWPLIYRGNENLVSPNMTLFAQVNLMDSNENVAMSLGQTYLTTDGAPEPLSELPLDLATR
ncbi:Xaa-Pro dipeptidase [Cohaesibacter sp. ES.047]|uniref:M24 family metallopeptidase n=1 Tax=Cohaesibacter sp. ES.047 TaxID=1798205 RepID=UPI000BB94A3C|nr:Xaa-Pro peptidase family protein [Cohaesibacter sp. ES.047]SNY91498.1 Xaa-Pro dipeptidase [Cohaesibacter sp. ES.047]